MSSSSSLISKITKIQSQTQKKLNYGSSMTTADEFEELEQMDLGLGAAPEKPEDIEKPSPQYYSNLELHDTMVKNGLCEAAVQHADENRYCNMFPFDEHRVKLTGHSHDYINASWVSMPGLIKNKLILTQSPLYPVIKEIKFEIKGVKERPVEKIDNRNTCPQFWRMIKQEKVSTIVLLCKLEPDYDGCTEYFPNNVGDELVHGKITIKNISKESSNGVDSRMLELTDSSGEKHTVQHLHFTEWANEGFVRNQRLPQLLSFVKTVENVSQSGAPIVIQCSGGIGRSGTFAMIYTIHNVIQEALAGEENKILDDLVDGEGALYLAPLVKHLREIRHPWTVEGEEQYTFAYKICNLILIEFIKGASTLA